MVAMVAFKLCSIQCGYQGLTNEERFSHTETNVLTKL